jgi:hypothetical protein
VIVAKSIDYIRKNHAEPKRPSPGPQEVLQHVFQHTVAAQPQILSDKRKKLMIFQYVINGMHIAFLYIRQSL